MEVLVNLESNKQYPTLVQHGAETHIPIQVMSVIALLDSLKFTRLQVPYILMSLQADLENTVSVFLKKIKVLNSIGVKDIILDPGYGFGKDIIAGNYSLLSAQQQLKDTFNLPLLVCISRKRMVWRLLDSSADEALNGTTVLNTLALERGADILRVHDVRAAVEAVKIFTELRNNS